MNGDRRTQCLRPRRRVLRPASRSMILATTLAIGFGAAALADESAYNPQPAAGDVILPMPGGYKMVFRKIAVPGDGYWGKGERILVLGDEDTTVFSPKRTVRIGANFRNGNSDWYLVIGKYEVSIGQYAMLMGNGDLAAGLKIVADKIGDKRLANRLKPDNRFIDKTLALPIRSLTFYDYQEFIARYNQWCFANAQCNEAVRDQFGEGGYFRLPTEFEWEYVARGGREGVVKREQLPFPPDKITDFANVNASSGRKKNHAKPIGSLQPVSGLYDIFGNVAEYMAEPYTMDYGFGTVGGQVARGGSYFNTPSTLSVFKRIEVPLFRSSQTSIVPVRSPFYGIRLMVGAPATEGKGVIQKIEEEHKAAYIPVGGGGPNGGDLAGNSRRKAKKLGAMTAGRVVPMADRVGGDDSSDYFVMTTDEFGDIDIDVSVEDGAVVADVQLVNRRQRVAASPGRPGRMSLKNLLPGTIYVRFYSSSGTKEVQYSAKATFTANDAPGNLAKEAQDLGRLTSNGVTINQWVGRTDKVDYYKFRLDSKDTISLRVFDLSGDANVELRDASDKLLTDSKFGGRANEKIEYANAAPGDYYVRVYLAGTLPSEYKMALGRGAVDTAGQTITTARDLGLLQNRAMNIAESVGGADASDYYKVAAAGLSLIKVELGSLTSDADLQVLDRTGKVIYSSTQTGTTAERIYQRMDSGTFYVVVVGKGGTPTPYALNVEVQSHLPYDDFRLAYQLDLSSGTARFGGRFVSNSQHRWAKVYLSKPGKLQVNLSAPGADSGANLDITVWHNGKNIYRSTGPSANEFFSRDLPVGLVFVDIHNPKGDNTPYNLVTRFTPSSNGGGSSGGSGGSGGPFSGGGSSSGGSSSGSSGSSGSTSKATSRVVANYRDWTVGVGTNSTGGRYCYAYTNAVSVSPFNWRKRTPTLYFDVNYQVNNRVGHRLDYTAPYKTEYPITATVTIRGRSVRIPAVRISNNAIDYRSLERCGSGWCVSNRGMRAFSDGTNMTFTGRTSDGRPSRVEYSLYGFKDAITRMNRECRVRNTLVKR